MNSTVATSFPYFITNMFNSGDPLVLDKTFVRHSTLPFCLIVFYVLMSKYIGPWWMSNKKSPNIQALVLLYDIFCVAANALIVYQSTKFLPTYGWRALCREAQNPSEEIVRSELVNVVYSLYMLKFVEMLDTVFFVLRKKFDHVSNFHLFHHSTAPILVWLTLRSQRRMAMMVYGVLNCVIHIFMYSYYGLSTMGPKFPKLLKWKRYITMLQITQFIVMIPYFIFMLVSDCATTKLPMIVFLIHTLFLLTYFFEFYGNNYSSTNQKPTLAFRNQEILNFAAKNEKSKKL